MISITTFIKHHEEVRNIVNRARAELDLIRITSNPVPVVRIIREFFSKFSLHLAMENSMFYPFLIESKNLAIKESALRFKQEMDDMENGFEIYKKKWAGPVSIACNPKGFIEETEQMFINLDLRMNLEEGELYHMADVI